MCASIEELNRKWSKDIAEKFIESDDPIKKLLGYNTLAITAVHCELEDHIKVCKKAELAAIKAKVAIEPPNAAPDAWREMTEAEAKEIRAEAERMAEADAEGGA